MILKCIFRLLQRKSKEEIKQAQAKLVEIRNALHSLTNVYNQIRTKNITNNTKVTIIINTYYILFERKIIL